MIVGESSLLQLASKSSIHPVACMNLRTVPGAELLGVGSVGVAQDTFILRYALPVVWRLQCPFSLRRDVQSTAPSVTLKPGAAPYSGRLGYSGGRENPSSQGDTPQSTY